MLFPIGSIVAKTTITYVKFDKKKCFKLNKKPYTAASMKTSVKETVYCTFLIRLDI